MSLHRILNADGQGSPSVPGANGSQVDLPQPVIDPALAEISQSHSNNSSREQPTPRRSSRHSQSQHHEQPVESSPVPASQPISHIQFMQGPGYPHSHPAPAPALDAYAGEWVPPPLPGVPSSHPPYFANGNTNGHIPTGAVIPAPEDDDSDGAPEANGRGRKRKANDDDDADYHPRSGRRVCATYLLLATCQHLTDGFNRTGLEDILLGRVTTAHPSTMTEIWMIL